jgi:hypothetical protein
MAISSTSSAGLRSHRSAPSGSTAVVDLPSRPRRGTSFSEGRAAVIHDNERTTDRACAPGASRQAPATRGTKRVQPEETWRHRQPRRACNSEAASAIPCPRVPRIGRPNRLLRSSPQVRILLRALGGDRGFAPRRDVELGLPRESGGHVRRRVSSSPASSVTGGSTKRVSPARMTAASNAAARGSWCQRWATSCGSPKPAAACTARLRRSCAPHGRGSRIGDQL